MGYLSQVDASFLHMESDRTPMHVAGLLVFRLPANAPEMFLRTLYRSLLSAPVKLYPFNCRIKVGIFSGIAPYWLEDDAIDMEYHVRRAALPSPGGERELGQWVERVHSQPLDITRPLWEFHIVEGLSDDRFACYFKVHHSAIDGMGAMALLLRWLSDNPHHQPAVAPWALPVQRRRTQVNAELAPNEKSFFSRSLDAVKVQAAAAAELTRTLYHMNRVDENPEGGMQSALHTPKTPFNVHISPHRRVATQSLEMHRVKQIGESSNATVNDVVLTVVGTALRRYLKEQNALPLQPLVASVPIALSRPRGTPGNAVAGFVCPLETQFDDPVRRLEVITTITARTKKQLQSMSKAALRQFSAVGIAPMLISQVTGLGASIPPLFNLVVSNVVASRRPLYLNGALLEAMYPVSLLFDGYALNITMVGYADRLSMGFLGCRLANPSLQRLAVYTGEALDELEGAVSQRRPNTADSLMRKKMLTPSLCEQPPICDDKNVTVPV